MMAWFGGISVDFHDAQLAPGARLSVHSLFGGIALDVPPEWRVESTAKAINGGVDVRPPAGDDPDAPVLLLDGLAVFGGVAVGTRKAAGAVLNDRP